MTFDSDISEDISLSRILDFFIEDNEDCSVIVNFLKKYDTDIKDILENSKYRHRIFSLDFIRKCSISETEALFDVMREGEVDVLMVTYCIWQILHSDISENIKKSAHAVLDSISACNYRHPYHGAMGYEAMTYDALWNNGKSDITEIAYKLNRLDDNMFLRIVKSLCRSLWVFRFLQKDLFELLDLGKQWIIVNNLDSMVVNIEYFFRQMFSSDIDIEVKKEMLRRFYAMKKDVPYKHMWDTKYTPLTVNLPSELKQSIDGSSSYAQLVIKMTLFGMDNYIEDTVMYLLYHKRFEFLSSILEYGRDALERNYDVCDLLEWVRDTQL